MKKKAIYKVITRAIGFGCGVGTATIAGLAVASIPGIAQYCSSPLRALTIILGTGGIGYVSGTCVEYRVDDLFDELGELWILDNKEAETELEKRVNEMAEELRTKFNNIHGDIFEEA